MNKKVKYTKNGAIIGALTFTVANIYNQEKQKENNPNYKFDWKEFFTSVFKGALIGGSAGLFVGAIADSINSNIKPLDTSLILNYAISKMRLNKNDNTYLTLSNKADNISELITHNFSRKLGGTIVRIGSTEENTALSDNYDIDISVPFASNSYSSTAEMYNELHYFLKHNIQDKSLVAIRCQKKSIGLIFDIEGEEFKIDIVPYKLSSSEKSKTSGYLFVNNNSFLKSNSYTKTDITRIKSIKLSAVQQKIHIAIKAWKKNYDIPLSSHLAKSLIIDAYKSNKGKMPNDFTKKLVMVIGHIRNEINFKKIVSAENTNNVLTNIPFYDKIKITKACDEILDDFDYQPNSILRYFTKAN